MRPRRLFFFFAGFILLLGILIVFSTIPPQPTGTQTLATPTVNNAERLSGETIEGTLVFSREGLLWNWQGNKAVSIPIEPGNSIIAGQKAQLTQPVISPDRKFLAYIRQDETYSDLWLASPDGKNPRNLTNNKGDGIPRTGDFNNSSLWAFSPVFSPDSSQLAFLSDNGTDNLLLWVSPLKNFRAKRVSSFGMGQGGIQHPSWAPDGIQIAVNGFDAGKPQIYSLKINTGEGTRLTEAPEGAYDPAFSPDGKYIAYVIRRGNSTDLGLMRADGTAQLVLESGIPARNPRWSPDGNQIAFLGLKGAGFEIFSLNLNPTRNGPGGEPKQISREARIDPNGGLAWSP